MGGLTELERALTARSANEERNITDIVRDPVGSTLQPLSCRAEKSA